MDNQITRKDVTDALQQLNQGQGITIVKLLQRVPPHFLAEALTREVENGEAACDASFLAGLGSVLWRTLRFQEQLGRLS